MTGLSMKDPESHKVLGVDVGIRGEEGAELGVGVGPRETRTGDSRRDLLVIEVRPGLTTS